MDYSALSIEELLKEIDSFKSRNMILESNIEQLKTIEDELRKKQEEFEFAWAGNLGRWNGIAKPVS